MSWQGDQRDSAARVEFVQTRTTAEAVTCPEPSCGAAPGETCRYLHSGEPLVHQPAHDKRIKKARG